MVVVVANRESSVCSCMCSLFPRAIFIDCIPFFILQSKKTYNTVESRYLDLAYLE